MTDYIIIAVIIVFIIIGVQYTIKHFRGQGGCCGGGSYKPKKKKLSKVIYQKTFTLEGMHCKNCKYRVEEIINDIKGVSGKADLKNGELTVSYSEHVEDELIKSRIEKAGYTVTKIV